LLDPQLQRAGLAALEARTPKPVKPEIQRANNGDIIGLDPQTGAVLFTRPDPNPKPSLNWIPAKDPVTGELRIIPVGPNGPITGGSGAAQPPATLPPDFDFGDGGPAASPPATFP
jgi:hypothetical protein